MKKIMNVITSAVLINSLAVSTVRADELQPESNNPYDTEEVNQPSNEEKTEVGMNEDGNPESPDTLQSPENSENPDTPQMLADPENPDAPQEPVVVLPEITSIMEKDTKPVQSTTVSVTVINMVEGWTLSLVNGTNVIAASSNIVSDSTTVYTFDISSNGTYTATLTKEGEKQISKSITISNIDTVAPTLGDPAYKNSRVRNTITVNAKDNMSTTLEYVYVLKDGTEVRQSKNTYTYSKDNLIDHVDVYDEAGNKVSFEVDFNTVVLGPIQYSSDEEEPVNGWYNQRKFTVTITSTHSSRSKFYYSEAYSEEEINVPGFTPKFSTKATYSKTKDDYTVKHNGKYTVFVYKADEEKGDATSQSFVVEGIDDVGPNVSLDSIATNYKENEIATKYNFSNEEKGVKVTVNVEDDGVGNGSKATLKMADKQITSEVVDGKAVFDVKENGTYTFSTSDIFGNESQPLEVEIKTIDTNAPEYGSSDNPVIIDYNKKVGGLFVTNKNSMTVTIPIKDDLSGIDTKNTKLYVLLPNAVPEVISGEFNSQGLTFTLNKELVNKIESPVNKRFKLGLYVVDNVGNSNVEEGEDYKILKYSKNKDDEAIDLDMLIDNKAPTIESDQKMGVWLNQDADKKLGFTITDDFGNDYSGIDSYSISVNGVNKGTHTVDGNYSGKESIYYKASEADSDNRGKLDITVTATDNAGLQTVKTFTDYIDETSPEVSISFDNNNSTDGYFNADRTAIITVKEMNFSTDSIKTKVTKDGKNVNVVNWVGENVGTKNAVWTATIPFTSDGDYAISLTGKDAVGNPVNNEIHEQFTIDKTAPKVSVAYDNNSVQNGKYYNANRTATVTIVEHNFDTSLVDVSGAAITSWTHQGDTHIATIPCTEEKEYTINLSVTDKSGNKGKIDEQNFIIDKTKPEISISGVIANTAYSGSVIPRFALSDTNYNPAGVQISYSGAHQGTLQFDGGRSSSNHGEVLSWKDLAEIKSNDDVYTISVTVTDLAGNSTSQSITYSVNRFGSTYVADDYFKDVLNKKYIQSINKDIKFSEINVNDIDNIIVRLSVNGKVKELVRGKDYTVEKTNASGWSQYNYKLNKELFKNDGIYELFISSKDLANNLNENTMENKQSNMVFTVDKTAPTIAIVDIEDAEFYNTDAKEFHVLAEDNIELEGIKVLLNDKEITQTNKGKEDEEPTFVIPEAGFKQNVKVIATDKAGNTYEAEVKNVTVSTNFFVRLYNNTPVFIGTIVALIAVVAGLFFLVGKRKKDED